MTNTRLTVEALRYYVPIFQECEVAEKALEFNRERDLHLTPSQRVFLENHTELKNHTVSKLADYAAPLINQELHKIISKSYLNGYDDLYYSVYYAGIEGMKKGLRKFEVDKLKNSSTNYLFQWITTYAKQELLAAESPFGIAPARFQKYKKISAVRKKLAEELDRDPTDGEVHEFFQSGKADLTNMNGRVANKGKPSKANLAITLDLVVEQREFEDNMMTKASLDYKFDLAQSHEEELRATMYEETFFGMFCQKYDIDKKAEAVIISEMEGTGANKEIQEILSMMSKKDYKKILDAWKLLILDINGPLYKFLQEIDINTIERFDSKDLMEKIAGTNNDIDPSSYEMLFANGLPESEDEDNDDKLDAMLSMPGDDIS